ncbi:MAG: hypothetical protein O7F73_08575 [Gammaproteobacteria bacterium]|nr:hypothetical protein [Gammaproteobacteria bacterium]
MLLFSFLARDILWQGGDGEFNALQAHYQRLLGRRVWDIKVQDRHSLWRAVSTELEGIDNEKRRELHNQYRAA